MPAEAFFMSFPCPSMAFWNSSLLRFGLADSSSIAAVKSTVAEVVHLTVSVLPSWKRRTWAAS